LKLSSFANLILWLFASVEDRKRCVAVWFIRISWHS